jgi:hypothetical protein
VHRAQAQAQGLSKVCTGTSPFLEKSSTSPFPFLDNAALPRGSRFVETWHRLHGQKKENPELFQKDQTLPNITFHSSERLSSKVDLAVWREKCKTEQILSHNRTQLAASNFEHRGTHKEGDATD